MIYDFMRLAGVPARVRKATVYRGVRLWPVCLGHLRLLDMVLPDGLHDVGDFALLACILAVPPSVAQRRILRGKLPTRTLRVAPRNDAERATLADYLRAAWRCPDRYRDSARTAKPKGPHEREYASTAALRMMARVARIPGVAHLMGPRSLEEIPLSEALAWIVADDELEGAHYMSRDTDDRFTRRRNSNTP